MLLVACLALTASGCGSSPRGAVRGKVTLGGEPLAEGQISFIPLSADLGPTAGAVIRDGAYEIDAARGPLAGEYQVQIFAMHKTGKRTWDGMGDENAPASKKIYVEEVKELIPPRYNAASELRATIEAGQVNQRDFDLKVETRH